MSEQEAQPAGPAKIPHTYLRGNVYWGKTKVDGQTLRESLRTSDPVEAERRVRSWLASVNPRFSHVDADTLMFDEVASSWIEEFEHQYTEKTWDRYKVSMRVLAPYFAHLPWAEVTRQALVDYMADRRAKAAPRKLTNATLNRDLAVMSNIFEHAIDKGWSDDNPVRRLSKKARREKRDPFTLPTDEMVEAVFARMHSTFGELCRFALLTGMRKDEIQCLEWSQVRLQVGIVQLYKTKNGRARAVTLCPEAIELLTRIGDRRGHVFKTRGGTPYTRGTEMWREIMTRTMTRWQEAQAGAQREAQPFIRFRFHDLRHMYAIRYLRNGGNLYRLQKELGHSTIRQTEEYLQYLTPEEQLTAKG